MKNNINQDTTQPKQPQRRFRFLDRNCDSSSTSHGFLTGAHQFRRYSFHLHPPLHFLTIIFLFDIFVMPLLLVIAAQSWPAGINRAAQLVPSIDNTNDNNGEQAGRTKKEGGGPVCKICRSVEIFVPYSTSISRHSPPSRKIASREIGASVICRASPPVNDLIFLLDCHSYAYLSFDSSNFSPLLPPSMRSLYFYPFFF